MSPEQVRAKELDARSDLFSLGVVLYEMATGVLPFRGESTGVIFDAILNRSPVPAVRLNPDLPADLERIINRALEKDRELRYLHASDMRAELQRVKRDTESGRSVVTQEGGSQVTPQPSLSQSSSVPSSSTGAKVVEGSRSGGRFWKSGELFPKRERVLASLAECTGGQCKGSRCLDLAANIVEKRLGYFLTPEMTGRSRQSFAASIGVDGKQFVHPCHNRSCNRVSGI